MEKDLESSGKEDSAADMGKAIMEEADKAKAILMGAKVAKEEVKGAGNLTAIATIAGNMGI